MFLSRKKDYLCTVKNINVKISVLYVSAFLIMGMLFVSCSSSRKAAKSPTTVGPVEVLKEHSDNSVVREAEKWIGTPYGYGRNECGVATDCSGMVMEVYKKCRNINLPRNSAKQAEFCRKLSANEVQSGDLVFFAFGKDSTCISHVGIIIDKENFIHSSSSRGVVVSSLLLPYWSRAIRCYGRP